jgi:hypothetical protein
MAKPKSGFQVTEADTLELLQKQLPTIIEDMLAEQDDGVDVSNEPVKLPLSLIAHAASRVTVRRMPRG